MIVDAVMRCDAIMGELGMRAVGIVGDEADVIVLNPFALQRADGGGGIRIAVKQP